VKPFRVYAREVLKLARQQGGFTAEEILHRLYYNMVPEARLHLAWENLRSIEYLILKIEEWEITWKAVEDRKAAARKVDVLQYLLSIRLYEFECCTG
jgi:hypothetical protein